MSLHRYVFTSIIACILITGLQTAAWGQDNFGETSVFATNSIYLGPHSDVKSGNVVVNAASPGPTLNDSKELCLYNSATAHNGVILKGDSVELKNKADLRGDVHYNDIVVHNKATIGGAQVTPLALPIFSVLPQFRTGIPGTEDITVPKNELITLDAGDYGDIKVKRAAKIKFSGGVYNVRSIDVKNWGELKFLAPTEIRVAERVKTANQVYVGKAGGSNITPDQIVFHVAGINGTSGGLSETPKAAQIGKDSEIFANFYVPNGTFKFLPGTIAKGAFLARDVFVGNGCRVDLASAFTENIAPVVLDDAFSVDQGGTFDAAAAGFSLLDNDSDPNPFNTLSVTTEPVVRPLYGDLTLSADGTFVYTHNGSISAQDSFVYEVCDNGDPVLCSQGNVTITVNLPANQPPVADPQTVITGGADGIVITLIGSDPDNDSLTFSVPVSGDSGYPSQGNLSNLTPIIPPPVKRCSVSGQACNDDNDCQGGNDICETQAQAPTTRATVTYTPNTGDNLVDSFTFQVDDGNNATDSAVVTINPSQNEVPDPPETIAAENIDLATEKETPLTLTLVADAPQGVSVIFAIVTDPNHGDLADLTQGSETPRRSATVTYTPASGHLGEDSFTYSACDEAQPQICDTAEVTVRTVDQVPEPLTLATDVSATMMVQVNEQVDIILIGNTVDPGSAGNNRGADNSTQNAPALIDIGAVVAGVVADENGDGIGDNHDALPGSIPLLGAAGINYFSSVTLEDPDDDAGNSSNNDPDPDVVFAKINSDGRVLNLTVRYKPGTFDIELTRAQFLLDTDRNPDTGHPGSDSGCENDNGIIGTEYLVNMGGNLENVAWVYEYGGQCNLFHFVGTADVTFHADGMNATVPLALLGDDDGSLNVKVTISENLASGTGNTGVLDTMPDVGSAAGQAALVQGSMARLHMEFPLEAIEPDLREATVILNTKKGQFDIGETWFYFTTDDGNGLLEDDDFQAPIGTILAEMLVPLDQPVGTEDQFSFDVTEQVVAHLYAGKNYLSLQGRAHDIPIEYQGLWRGLQIRSSALGNQSPDWLAPKLLITPSGLNYAVLTLPDKGTLKDQNGVAITEVPYALPGPKLSFAPETGFIGNNSFTYEVSDGVQAASAMVYIDVLACDCLMNKVCCNAGR